MPSIEPALCVSVHDVAPHTWPLCERLLQAIDEVAQIPLTLLVVPAYHRLAVPDARGFERFLNQRLARGDELALHGYTHLDEGPAPRGMGERFKRNVYTVKEGEFSAIDESEARRRLELGLAWFEERGWPVQGFVAPAWLLGAGAWQALEDLPFSYTTTLQDFYLLPEKQAIRSPSLVYTARNAIGRSMSCGWNSFLSEIFESKPLVRLGLHPNDAHYPMLIAHYQKLIRKLLVTHVPMTKAAFAAQFGRSMPDSRLALSALTQEQSVY